MKKGETKRKKDIQYEYMYVICMFVYMYQLCVVHEKRAYSLNCGMCTVHSALMRNHIDAP